MKLLFLDMDGVLNSHSSSRYFWRTVHGRKTFMNGFEELCPIACDNLDWLLEADPEIKVVISSTWRLFHELKEWDEKMTAKCPSILGRVIDKTPTFRDAPRGDEIHAWLERNGHLETPFVVLDDDSDMQKVTNNFIHIDNAIGLTWHQARQAGEKLGVKLD